jgi:hypothetical protein
MVYRTTSLVQYYFANMALYVFNDTVSITEAI